MSKMLPVILFLSLSAQASSVGDSITRTFTSGGNTGTIKTEVVSYQGDVDQYTVSTLLNLGGQTQTSYDQFDSSDIMTKQRAAVIVQNCNQIGGMSDTIEAAGTFWAACRLPVQNKAISHLLPASFQVLKDSKFNNGYAWLSTVPVDGLIKIQNYAFQFIMTDYNWAR